MRASTGDPGMSSLQPSDLAIDPQRRERGFSLLPRLMALAFRVLWRSRSRTFITLASLVFGQVMMILAFGFVREMHRMLPDQVCRGSSGHVQLLLPGYLKTQKVGALLPAPIPLEKLKAIDPRVTGERPRITIFGFLEKDDDRQLVVARGVDPARENQPLLTAGQNIPPEAKPFGPYPVYIGKDVAAALKVGPDDLVNWHFITTAGALDNVQVRVVGVVDQGIPDLNRRTLAVHVDTARKILDVGTSLHEQQVFIDEAKNAEDVSAKLQAGLGKDVEVAVWQVFNPQLRRTMRVSYSQTMVVAFIVVVVILFGIGSTVSMSASERIREFGLFGVLGMGPRTLFAYVLCEAMVVGMSTLAVSSVIVTLALAYWGQHGIDLTVMAGERIVLDGILIDMRFRPSPDLWDILKAVTMVLGASLLAACVPAWRASRLQPAQALRNVS